MWKRVFIYRTAASWQLLPLLYAITNSVPALDMTKFYILPSHFVYPTMMQLCSYALPIVESMGPNKSHHSNISETQSDIPQINCNAVCTCTNKPASALSHTSKHIYTTRTTYHYMQELFIQTFYGCSGCGTLYL